MRFDGTDGADWLTGEDGRDYLYGGKGDDTLQGGEGPDRLTGGKGADTFLFLSVDDSPNGISRADQILDFESGVDVLDLSQIDANVTMAGYQAFEFIGSASFDGEDAAGQLRYDDRRGILYASVDADDAPELMIRFRGGDARDLVPGEDFTYEDTTAPSLGEDTVLGALAENSGAGQLVYTPAAIVDPNPITFSLAGADAAYFSVNETTGAVTLTGNPDYEAKSSYVVELVVTDHADNSDSQQLTLSVTDVNEAATAVALQNTTTSIAENTSTAARIKVADIAITDDALGTETISLTGEDAASFEVDAGVLYLRASTTLNYEAKTSYAVTVNADDLSLTMDPLTASLTVNVTDVNEAPTALNLTNTVTSGAENTSTASRIKVADIAVTDDALGTETYSLSGADSAFFEIDAGALYLKAGTTLDYESKSSYAVTVEADDLALTMAPLTASLTLTLTDVNEGISISSVAATTAGLQFTASDVDIADVLSYSAPFASFGAVNDGSQTTLTASAQGSVTTGEVKVTDGEFTTSTGVIVGMGTTGADTISLADTAASAIWGFGGDDSITPGGGADTVAGGDGNDTINLAEASSAADVVQIAFGGAGGADTISGFSIADDRIEFIGTDETSSDLLGVVTTRNSASSSGTPLFELRGIFVFDTTATEPASLSVADMVDFLNDSNSGTGIDGYYFYQAGSVAYIAVASGGDTGIFRLAENDAHADSGDIQADEIMLIALIEDVGNAVSLTGANFIL